MNVCRLANRNLTEKLLQILFFSKLVSDDYKSSFRNTKSSEDNVYEKLIEKILKH